MEQHNKVDTIQKAVLHTPSANAKASIHTNGKTEVLQGAVMKAYTGKEMTKMKAIFEQLVKKGVIVLEAEGKAKFAKTYAFHSANEAASFLLHRGGDNSAAWHKAEGKPAAVKKQQPKHTQPKEAEKKHSAKPQQHPSNKKAPSAKKAAAPQAKHAEKKQTSYPKKSANSKSGSSRRKDPRNPRGIRPQGNEAAKSAPHVDAIGYIRFAGMGQGVKVKH